MEKKIDYLEYFVRGEKIMGCGFVRTILRDDRVSLDVTVNGLKRDWPWEMKVVAEKEEFRPVELNCGGEWHSVGYICLAEGAGTFHLERRVQSLDEKEMRRMFRWCRIRIPMDEKREIRCEREREETELVAAEIEITEEEQTEEEQTEKEDKVDAEEGKKVEDITEGQPDLFCKPEQLQTNRDSRITKQMGNTKWEQMQRIYPCVTPFNDEREYLSIQPTDFLLFTEDSYQKADNSFARHGYCNYGYLILAKVEKCEESIYYLGVPGNYYSKEVVAAKYFGFDAFEGQHEVTQDGEFGYYMMKVQL